MYFIEKKFVNTDSWVTQVNADLKTKSVSQSVKQKHTES